ncbi:aminoacyl-tRNA hydrolase [Candidatus Microgenomates bacterium]|nr:MAG: aminoacyl-tRNA hydrolase [Candidatus Microgenomates bacterium]
MILLIGLGNPGEKYTFTRHNIGFMVVDRVFKDLVSVEKKWEARKDFNASIFKTGDLIFLKPQTFMNASGVSVKKAMQLYKVPPESIWVVHDDIDLPLGKIRIRQGGGSAGHHGIESIIRETGNDAFIRFRLGVGRATMHQKERSNQNLPRHNIEKYVVSPFLESEEGEVRKLIKHAAQAVQTAIHKGFDKAMNEYN